MTAEARLIDRHRTGHPTVGRRNRALFMGGADMCIAIHSRFATCRQDAQLRSAGAASWETSVRDRECARDPQADQAGGCKTSLRRRGGRFYPICPHSRRAAESGIAAT